LFLVVSLFYESEELFPAIRYNLFLLNLFFQELSGASFGRSARSGKNRFIQKRISAAIRARPEKQEN